MNDIYIYINIINSTGKKKLENKRKRRKKKQLEINKKSKNIKKYEIRI